MATTPTPSFRALNAAAATGAGEVWNPQNRKELDYGVAQAVITETATVVIEGRLAPDLAWAVIHTFTVSGMERITLAPEMQARVSAYTSGTVTVELRE